MRARVLHLMIGVTALFGILVFKLAQLQVRDAELWDKEALKSRTRAETVAARRGAILDRERQLLATSESSYDLLFVLGRFRASTIGLLPKMHYLLYQVQPTLGELHASADAWITQILATKLTGLARLEPRQRRRDVRSLMRQLTGEPLKTFDAEMRVGEQKGQTIAEAFPELRATLAKRIDDEFGWLARLGELIDVDPVAMLDHEVAAIDGRVRRRLEDECTGGEIKDRFLLEKALHVDLDNRADRVLQSRVSYDVVDLVAMNPDRYQGFEIREVHRRAYPEPNTDLVPQLIGLVGVPEDERLKTAYDSERRLELLSMKEDKSPDEIDEMQALEVAVRETDYRPDEEQGREGLERTLEPLLRGRRGYRKVERDLTGQGVMTLEEDAAVAGMDVRLSLDAEAQRACEAVLLRTEELIPGSRIEAGAIVLATTTGEVLAAASVPLLRRDAFRAAIAEEQKHPTSWGGAANHRAFAPKAAPPPGSVFKPFVAIAGLESGVLDENTSVCCDFGIGVGRDKMRCLGRHDSITLRDAMAKSCNAYFGHAGELLGDERLRGIAKLFGFDEQTHFASNGLELLPGVTGANPFPFFEPRISLDRPNDAVRVLRMFGCGQGTLDDVTPMQVARAMAGLATGELPKLRMVLAIGDTPVPAPAPTLLPIRREVLETVRQALEAVVAPGGTARPQGEFDLRRFGLVGKSGTATVSTNPPIADDAWFAGYLPAHQPSLVVVLYLERASFGERSVHGGEAAVPILGTLFQDPRVSRYLGVRP